MTTQEAEKRVRDTINEVVQGFVGQKANTETEEQMVRCLMGVFKELEKQDVINNMPIFRVVITKDLFSVEIEEDEMQKILGYKQ